jgi:selenocysteine-specific elongation factor
MRSFVVGTAGHIDHGKSSLVRALTGTDPDRLKEEKERGITIDLGFAHLDLGGGSVASFIDVPGHERFVRNMLAGAHGIDAVMLVVAADESVMPQTREHFHICRLLGIRRGIVALTKCDVAEPALQAVAEAEVRELVAGSFLDAAPILRVSATSGDGLPQLMQALRSLAEETPPRGADGVFRLPVDRVFTLRGFGTVSTGTVISGAVAIGDEIEALPSGLRARVRGLQVHGAQVTRIEAGSRAALNLAGIEVEQLARGDVLSHPGTLQPTSMIDVALTLLDGGRPLENRTRVRVHLASAEVLARVRLLDAQRAAPGATTLAQLRLEDSAVAGRGDCIVLRAYSPAATIGGGVVLDPLPPKRRRVGLEDAAALRSLATASLHDAARTLVREAGRRGIPEPTLAARVTAASAAVAAALAGSLDVIALDRAPAFWISREAVGGLAVAVRGLLGDFHARNPLKPALGREELRQRIFAKSPDGAFDHVLALLAAAGDVRLGADAVALAQHSVRLAPAETEARDALIATAQAAGLTGVAVAGAAAGQDVRLFERVARVLQDEGVLRRVGDGLLLHRDHLDALKAEVRRRWPPGSRLDVAGFKELTGLSRKFVIPLLEYLDRERVTRRSGADRLVLA